MGKSPYVDKGFYSKTLLAIIAIGVLALTLSAVAFPLKPNTQKAEKAYTAEWTRAYNLD